MKIKKLRLKNFRSYKDEIIVEFDDLTAFVGKNDIGKSTILEALDIFFNDGKGVIKLDKNDINKKSALEGENEIIISVIFEELPKNIVIDSTNRTNLQSEFLLNLNGQLEIVKKYPNGGALKFFINANHPNISNCNDLLQKKNPELKTLVANNKITCANQTTNAVLREAIWDHFKSDLQLSEIEIDVTKGDTKSIWDKLQNYLPLYSLFQSDRKNSDGDSEVQDPLKEAVKQILNNEDLKKKFDEIAAEVEKKLKEVSERTLEKLREMNPDVANSLTPIIPPAESLKWVDVFKNVSISGDEDIPINKRGSGIKRLILLNFFRAEAERRKIEKNIPSIIYAIEEPETSQHTEHQKKLIKAFLSLSKSPNTQIIITTHSASLVKELKFKHLRLIKFENNLKTIEPVELSRLPSPSLNEVNYLAFSETTEEYHNELYGFINEDKSKFNEFKNCKTTKKYLKIDRNGKTIEQQLILAEYIRHQIHYPENTLNERYTFDELVQSIIQMREFLNNTKTQILITLNQPSQE